MHLRKSKNQCQAALYETGKEIKKPPSLAGLLAVCIYSSSDTEMRLSHVSGFCTLPILT